MRAHERLQQRIARQPVRAMQPRAGRFAHRKQSRDVRLAIHVRHHAAALIMRRRHHGNRLLRDVNAVAQARFVNVRKPLDDEVRRLDA